MRPLELAAEPHLDVRRVELEHVEGSDGSQLRLVAAKHRDRNQRLHRAGHHDRAAAALGLGERAERRRCRGLEELVHAFRARSRTARSAALLQHRHEHRHRAHLADRSLRTEQSGVARITA